MRQETQPWNSIRIACEIIDEGVGQTGLTVTATLRRSSDGQYLQSGGGWGASPSNLSLTQPSAANQPGLYRYVVDPADLDPSDGQYVAKITEATYSLLEYVHIAPTLDAYGLQLMLDLRQNRVRVIPSAWDSNSKQPTAGKIYVYRTNALYDADTTPNGTGAYASFDFAATFSSGRLQRYGSKPS